MVLAIAAPGEADLVVMVDGRVLRAKSVATVDGNARIELLTGGWLTVPLEGVDRVVNDEIETEVDPLQKVFVELSFREDQPVPDSPYGQMIYETAKRHSMNPALVAAVVQADSNFDPNAQSAAGARGLMLMMPSTARHLGLVPDELLDPELNLDAGVRYLVELSVRYRQNLALVLAAYKAGEDTVERYRSVPPFQETRDYIRQVYALLGVGPSTP